MATKNIGGRGEGGEGKGPLPAANRAAYLIGQVLALESLKRLVPGALDERAAFVAQEPKIERAALKGEYLAAELGDRILLLHVLHSVHRFLVQKAVGTKHPNGVPN